jgi:thioredoxin reductase (NADPH)
VAPPGGGQLVGKGVDVENYPGLANVTGPEVVAAMRSQAATFGAVFECESVLSIDTTERPFKVHTNSSEITTHAIIVATGAESNWLSIPGEYEMRGGGVSSCAICDGAAFYGKDVIVVGGGDTAMEEALVLARTSKSVTVIHRRDEFRASKILAQRVMDHPSIRIIWNSVLEKIVGESVATEPTDTDGDDDSVDLDSEQMFVTGALLKNVLTGEQSKVSCAAVFVAIGHTPSTQFLEGIVEFDDYHSGYLMTQGVSTRTSVPGIFAAGDVSDAIYRQAVTSAGSGAAAALDAERWLSEEGLGNEEAEFEAALMAELMADDFEKTPVDQYNAYEDAGVNVAGMKESARVEL